jgi:2',3'-cyclic-nucleotide 2'-phosphodiesterase (5'-nucleotidase family)
VILAGDDKVAHMIDQGKAEVAPLARLHLGTAEAVITRDRYKESPLADFLTDSLRQVSGAEAALLNTGGLRDDLQAGEVAYEDLFEVLPFGNHAVLIGPVSFGQLFRSLERSARSCGSYGALMQSGLKVVFERDCNRGVKTAVDPDARILHVETVSGEVLQDMKSGIFRADRLLSVATLDFLAAGGAGYGDLSGFPVLKDLGIFREVLSQEFAARPVRISPRMDQRWQAIPPVSAF